MRTRETAHTRSFYTLPSSMSGSWSGVLFVHSYAGGGGAGANGSGGTHSHTSHTFSNRRYGDVVLGHSHYSIVSTSFFAIRTGN